MRIKVSLILLIGLFALVACNPNKPPTTQLSVSRTQVYADIEEIQVTFSAADPEGAPVTCALNFGDGSVLNLTACSLGTKAHTYDQAGSYTVTFTASDNKGATSRKQLTVNVLDSSKTCYAAIAAGSSKAIQTSRTSSWPASDAAYVPGQLLVQLPTGNVEVTLELLKTSKVSAPLRALRTIEPPKELTGPTWVLLETTPGQEEAVARALLNNGQAVAAQPNYIYGLLALPTPPNDPLYNSDQAAQFQLIGLESAWASALDPSNDALDRLVAVVDSGVAYNHVDLEASVDNLGKDFSDEDGIDGYPTNSSGPHGTIVGSIIAAETNNNEGVAGVTYNTAKLLPLKVFPGGTSDILAQAINEAVTAGADVINLSLCILNNSGTCANLYDTPDTAIENALQNAYQNGVVAVAASGNFADDWVGYPASSPYTIAVGSVNAAGQRSSFSNGGTRLDLVAPGENMAGATFPIDDGGNPAYVQGDGTSFSTPVVAGVAALYMRQYKSAKGQLPSPKQVARCLCATAQDRGDPGFDTGYGAGIVRADHALNTVDAICYP
ncbi:MAG TPA: PKD domain-containing protein [Oceanithermus profundus]|uniref:PKD domain-containing protein n=1 Tax=Oceanithermus profundus TaxID=187137 RepID=A0A7C4V595_9DEIN|nr:PKD domain-containing protein [Oceanithermus profundus]